MAVPFVASDLDVCEEDTECDTRLVQAPYYLGRLADGVGDIAVPNACVASKTSQTIPVHGQRKLA